MLTPTQLTSPSKFSINHGHFMANLDSQDSPTRSKVERQGQYSTTKVIENLHKQIDELTNTNLKITSQCHHLVGELESSGKTHQKQVETISRLQTENVNLSAILDRKTNRLEQLENSLQEMDTSRSTLEDENRQLKNELETFKAMVQSANDEKTRYQVQYDALADSQQRYKEYYTDEVANLRKSLTELSRVLEAHVETKFKEITVIDSTLDSRLNEYTKKLEKLELEGKENKSKLEIRVDTAINNLGLDNWQSLLKQSQDLLHGLTNSAATAGVKPQDQQLRVNKRRIASQKRSSFYGAPSLLTGSANPSNSFATNSTVLPGLKRSTSIRIPSDPNRNK